MNVDVPEREKTAHGLYGCSQFWRYVIRSMICANLRMPGAFSSIYGIINELKKRKWEASSFQSRANDG